MENFDYWNRTFWAFGRGTLGRVGELTERFAGKDANVLLHFGGGSIKRNGVYDVVVRALRGRGIRFVELGGVVPNPRLSLVREGIRLCREGKISFILAVGGGSVIDSAKAIAAGVPEENGDVWKIFVERPRLKSAIDVATVLTIPATGSEMSPNTVITDEESRLKLGYGDEKLRPIFSIVDPELFFTIPQNQIANGVSDMMSHIFERYFSNTPNCRLTDGLCESVLRTIIASGLALRRDAHDYDAWAEIGFAGTMAHNNLLGLGREQDWACHGMEHEISAIYDVAHGAGLSVVTPAWMKYVLAEKAANLAQFARNVFGLDSGGNDIETARLGIGELVKFYKEMGLPVTMVELGIRDDSKFEEMAKKAVLSRSRDGREIPQGHFRKLFSDDIVKIYRLAQNA
ncbi:MAG: iron-containing alcohol dehydrogenase [Opitutae bacterium]|nr:iron-containing alcohol dehydrogenase [Opitutae bacterium]